MALLFVLIACLLSTVSAVTVEEQFSEWMVEYGKQYPSQQETQNRLKIFSNNLDYINKHNENTAKTYEMGINQFADLTDEEFKKLHLMDPQHCSATASKRIEDSKPLKVPKAIDWRNIGAVTPVKNQGQCGSCWTFSTTGCLESHHFLVSKQLIELSEQQLVDCAQAFNNHGCEGGLPSQAFEYIRYNGGLEGEMDYPYKAHDEPCRFNKSLVRATVGDVFNITSKDEEQLYEKVGSRGPVSIAYDVASDFRFYKKGVYSSTKCGEKPDEVNHAVLVVGYNTTEDGVDYWIVKNSWGTSFGIDGYFWIERGKNMCGLADCASYPIL